MRNPESDIDSESPKPVIPEVKGRERFLKVFKSAPALLTSALFNGFSKNYTFHHNDFLYSYGHDFAIPLIYQFGSTAILSAVNSIRTGGRINDSKFARSIYNSGVAFSLCVAGEFLQTVAPYDSTQRFDNGDFLAYALGSSAAYLVSRFLHKS